jgi:hypothetical protein
MSDVPLSDQIKCAERELALRRRVYPNWVEAKRMSGKKAEAEIEAMSAIIDTLRSLQPRPLK